MSAFAIAAIVIVVLFFGPFLLNVLAWLIAVAIGLINLVVKAILALTVGLVTLVLVTVTRICYVLILKPILKLLALIGIKPLLKQHKES